MIHDTQLITKLLKNLQAFMYYRQRFDACPHYMFFLGDAHASGHEQSKYPIGQKLTSAYFSQDTADWLHPFEELQRTAKEVNTLLAKDEHVEKKMIKEFLPWQKKFYEVCEDIASFSLTELSDEELLRAYDTLATVYTKKLYASPIIDGFALTTDTLISQKIEEELEAKGRLKEFVKLFEVLTLPTFLSFLQEEVLALLHVAKQLKSNPSREQALLSQHQKKYFWIHNNYVTDHVLPISYFKKALRVLQKSDVTQRIKELQELPKNNSKKKGALIKELGLSSQVVNLLRVTDAFSNWQDERKKGTFWATHYLSLFLNEITQRTAYTLEELKYALPTELSEILKENIPRRVLRERRKGCLLVWVRDTYDITTKQSIINKVMQENTQECMHKEIRGMTVSLGNAKGRVRIVTSATEIHTVLEGDILVAVMTRPDYLPAMKKASGFVTDEGGITCHAAIVARELKKPCIVGTRVATQVLQDGDFVEVDANHGIVRMIKNVNP